MIEIHKKGSGEAAIAVPPPLRELQKSADAAIGTRVLITPEVATELLETRGDNRKVMQTVVDTYAKDMKEGRWVFNGAPIQFDEEGKLLNGQHRLWAVIESGVTIEAVVQWGIPRSAQATIDNGARWQGKDVLYMKGERNVHMLQAVLRWIYKDEIGQLLGTPAISNSQTQEILDRHPNVRRSVDFITKNRSPLYSTLSAFMHSKVSVIDQEKADEFFRRLSDGAELPTSSPIYRLRERLGGAWQKGQKLGHTDALALTIIAWNHFRAGHHLSRLVWVKAGPSAQPFPTIEGATLGTSGRVIKRKSFKPEGGVAREVSTGATVRHKS